MLVGIGVVIFDFFSARIVRKIYRNPEYWNEELNFPTLSPKDQKSFPRRKRLYEDAISHRFRKWGIVLFLVGSLLLATSSIVNKGVSY